MLKEVKQPLPNDKVIKAIPKYNLNISVDADKSLYLSCCKTVKSGQYVYVKYYENQNVYIFKHTE